jgi:hypothetical protein
MIANNAYRWHCQIKLGFNLSQCEKLEVTVRVRKKDLDMTSQLERPRSKVLYCDSLLNVSNVVLSDRVLLIGGVLMKQKDLSQNE